MTAADTDRRMLRRAARHIALQSAAGVTAVLALTGVAVFTVDQRAAAENSRSQLHLAVSGADDDVSDPPAGVDLVLRQPDGAVAASPGAPPAAAAGALLSRPDGFSGYRDGSEHYRVLTVRRANGQQVQALLDLRPEQRERDQLLLALLLGGAAGILGATVFGSVLARRAVRPLGDALALQRRFVADASHELRAPLTVLHTRAQVLARSAAAVPAGGGTAEAGPWAEQLAGLVADTRAMGEVVEDLLVAAELGERPASTAPVQLDGIAREVVASFAAYAAQSGIGLDLLAPEPVAVPGHAPALRRAISALVDNALGHEHPGGRVQVSVGYSPAADGPGAEQSRRRDPREAHVVVRDGGIGLDPARAEELFGRFARGGAAPGPGRRFGLGLSLVREVAVAHGGSVRVDGAPGKGATFTLVLPAGDDPA